MSISAPRTRFVVLGLLCSEAMSGYDLKRSIDETVGGFWQESYGQLYPTLKQLRAEGLVAETAASRGERRRTVYAITDTGRAALAGWLAEPAQPEHTRSEIALKVFFGAWAPSGVVTEHLSATVDRSRAQVARFDAVLQALAAGNVPRTELVWWRLTIDLGQRVARARAEWAESALATLRSTHD